MDKRLPPLQALLAFEAVAKLGSFSRAAAELALTQSAISHQIQNLEQWLGQSLFSRGGRGVTLTAAGELFRDTVDSALGTLRAGRQRIEPYRNPDSVILACRPGFASGWLIDKLAQLRASAPTLEVWLVTVAQLREIDRIDVDLIISDQALDSAGLESVALLEDATVAVCAPALARSLVPLPWPAVLQAAPLLYHEHQPDWAHRLAALDVSTQRAVTVDDNRLLLAAAEQGLGIALLSRLDANAALAAGRLCLLPQVPSQPQAGLWLTRSTLTPRTPAVQRVFDWLRQHGAGAGASA